MIGSHWCCFTKTIRNQNRSSVWYKQSIGIDLLLTIKSFTRAWSRSYKQNFSITWPFLALLIDQLKRRVKIYAEMSLQDRLLQQWLATTAVVIPKLSEPGVGTANWSLTELINTDKVISCYSSYDASAAWIVVCYDLSQLNHEAAGIEPMISKLSCHRVNRCSVTTVFLLITYCFKIGLSLV